MANGVWVFYFSAEGGSVLRRKRCDVKNTASSGQQADVGKEKLDPSDLPGGLASGGEMGKRIASKDWSATPLGSIDLWSQSLKTTLSICLGSKFPMFVWWGQDLTVFYNDAYSIIAGPEKHPKYLGAPARECWAEIWNVVGPLTEHVFATGSATWAEDMPLFIIRRGYLEETYFTFSYSPARDESGAVGGVFCAVQETTERVLGERRLKVLRELGTGEVKSAEAVGEAAARALMGNIKDVPFALLYLTKADGKSASLVGASGIKAGARAAPQTIDLSLPTEGSWPIARVFKSKKSERIDGLRSLFPGDMPKVPYEEMPDSAQLIPFELAGLDTPAGFVILGISSRLLFNDSYQGFFNLIVKQIMIHISNVRAIEEAKKRVEVLAEIDRAKTAFFSNVSHEFRTPLTLILGPLEGLLAGGKGTLAPPVQQEAEVIHRNALRLLKLVNTLLDFSRIEAGHIQSVYEPTDLASLTKDLASTFRSAVEKAEMKLVVDCPTLSELVFVDREMWEKIVLNLLSNAFKHTFKGEIRISLKKTSANTSELSVSDTGIGIAEHELPKLFERFHRVQGAQARTHEGTGIGLALVQELAKLHGGSVGVKSVLGKGSTFTVCIPLGASHLPQDCLSKEEKPLVSTATRAEAFVEEALQWIPNSVTADGPADTTYESSHLPKKRIVLADDNADMLDYVRKLLASRYEVITVSDGKKALETIQTHRPDLLISDIMMPVMNGIELLKTIRADSSLNALPVIFLSARAGEEEKISGLETGADDYLIKPFSANELLARVGTQIKLADIRRHFKQDLAKKVAELEKVNLELDSFVYTASHDLRSPLRAVSSFAGFLEEDYKDQLDATGRDHLLEIRKGVERMTRLIDDLLTLSRISRVQNPHENVEMNQLVEQAKDRVGFNFKEKAAEIHIQSKLPIVYCDRIKIKEVFVNLLDNAVKFSSKNNHVPKIEVGYQETKDEHEFYVADNGIGIEPRFHAEIFGLFKRLHTQEEYDGTGAGLNIVKRIIEDHKGRVWVESELGKTAKFIFTIPKHLKEVDQSTHGR